MCPRLNIGCGPNNVVPGWLNIDNSPSIIVSKIPVLKRFVCAWPAGVKRVNITNGLPFAPNSLDYVYSSHTLEHLEAAKALFVLRECFRVLRPAGIVRIALPDLRRIVKDYLNDSDPLASHRFIERLVVKKTWRDIVHPGKSHEQMYDAASLLRWFELAGFTCAAVCNYQESRIPDIQQIELAERAHESLYVEAEKAIGR